MQPQRAFTRGSHCALYCDCKADTKVDRVSIYHKRIVARPSINDAEIKRSRAIPGALLRYACAAVMNDRRGSIIPESELSCHPPRRRIYHSLSGPCTSPEVFIYILARTIVKPGKNCGAICPFNPATTQSAGEYTRVQSRCKSM